MREIIFHINIFSVGHVREEIRTIYWVTAVTCCEFSGAFSQNAWFLDGFWEFGHDWKCFVQVCGMYFDTGMWNDCWGHFTGHFSGTSHVAVCRGWCQQLKKKAFHIQWWCSWSRGDEGDHFSYQHLQCRSCTWGDTDDLLSHCSDLVSFQEHLAKKLDF